MPFTARSPVGPWIAVGRVEDLPAKGAWLHAPITPAGVVVTRDDDGELRAFHAVCTHRGSALFDEDAPAEGRGGPFTCPYHGMEFGLDGAPCGGPDVVRRTEPGPLRAVRVDDAFGFVFVTLADDAPPLDEALGETPPWLARAEDVANGRLERIRRVAYDVAARSSIVLENFQESLHFASVHPALESLTPSARAETWVPEDEGSPWLGGIMPITSGAETVSLSGNRNDRPWIVPDEDRRVVHDAMRAPNLLTSLQPDYLLTFVIFPIETLRSASLRSSTDDARTRIIASTYAHRDAPASSFADVTAFWDKVYDEDRRACERQERGLRSGGSQRFTSVEEGAEALGKSRPRHCGIFGQPYADLSELLDISSFPELHEEITRGLAHVETSYTGGTLKWMGVCAPWVMRDPYRDAMHAIREMTRSELASFVELGSHDVDLDATEPASFGDETDRPFTMAQMKLLEQRHGVYFPWKVCYHLLENDRWEDKHSGEGKEFSEEARQVFPKTVAFIESLPFTEIGRVVVFGLLPNDHAPAHRDSEPGKALSIAQSISFEPGRQRKKRFYLATPDGAEEVEVDAPIYWFNDMDWHGVKADPWFRYSVRVDGVFEPDFLERVRKESRQPRTGRLRDTLSR